MNNTSNAESKPKYTVRGSWVGRVFTEWQGALIGLIVGIAILFLAGPIRSPLRAPPMIEPSGEVLVREAGAWGFRLSVKDGVLVQDRREDSYVGARGGLELQVSRLLRAGNLDGAFRVVESQNDENDQGRLLLVIVDRVRSDQIPRGLTNEETVRISARWQEDWTDQTRQFVQPASPPSPSGPQEEPGHEIPAEPPVTRKMIEEIVQAEIATHGGLSEVQRAQEADTAEARTAASKWVSSVGKDLARASELAQSLSPRIRGEVLLAIANEAEPIGLANTYTADKAIKALNGGFWDSGIGAWLWKNAHLLLVAGTTLAGMIVTTVVKNFIGDFGSRKTSAIENT